MSATNPPRGGRRRLRAAVALASALAATAALTPAAARAGTYPMYACDVPGVNLPAPTRAAWTDFDTAGTVQHSDTCATTRHGAISFALNGFANLPQSANVGVQLQIPDTGPQSSISIERVIDWTRLDLAAQGPNQAPANGLNTGPVQGSLTEPPGGDTTGWTGAATSGPGHDSGLLAASTKLRRLGVFCAYWGGSYNSCTLPAPFMTIRGITTMLSEAAQPTSAIDGGGLTGAGPVKGTKTVAYTASDAESGIQRVDVTLDGAVVATDSFARDLTLPVDQQTGACTYDGLRACPATHSGLLSVDTTRVPDGTYELGVRTTDAAGNARTAVASQPVVVDNVADQASPNPKPVMTAPAAPGPAGATGDRGPAGAAATVLTLNGANASAGASLRASFSATHARTIRSAYGKRVLITGQLVAPSGTPITGARVAVMQQDKIPGAPLVVAGQVVTDGAGRFAYVTTAVRSRSFRFGYRAHLEDTAFASTTDVGLAVTARLTLATNRTALRNGQSVVFRGSVAGAPAKARKVIELQVRKGSRWMTFRSTRLRNGRFSERYRFTRTRGRITYVFRARVREEVGFPFLTSHSRAVKVTVRG
jgi:hypothetical protein